MKDADGREISPVMHLFYDCAKSAEMSPSRMLVSYCNTAWCHNITSYTLYF